MSESDQKARKAERSEECQNQKARNAERSEECQNQKTRKAERSEKVSAFFIFKPPPAHKPVTMKFDPLTHTVIGCAIEVHKILGPGLLLNFGGIVLETKLVFNSCFEPLRLRGREYFTLNPQKAQKVNHN